MRTDTSRWTSQFIVKVAIIGAALGFVGPLVFAIVRAGTDDEADRPRQVATVDQVALNSSPAASQVRPPDARQRQPATGASPTTVPPDVSTTSTSVAVVSPSTSTSTTTPAASAQQPSVVTVVDADDGKTIVLRRGQQLRVVLEGPTWQFAEPTDSKVLAPQGAPTYTAGEDCTPLPGTNCGTVTAEFRAGQAGASTLVAHRAPCGDPARFQCLDEQAKFQLEVRVRT